MRLRVLSLNAWALPPPVGQRVHERLSLVLRALPALDCDIALFQEIWTDEARAQVIEGGRSLGYRHTWTNPGPARGGSGLLGLSRWPIGSSRFRRFTLCGLPQRLTHLDYYGGKGVVRLDVEVNGVYGALFNTHMHARYVAATEEDEYQGHRAAEVIEFADEIRSVSGPLVAVGDFNMRDTAPEYRVMRGLTGLVDVAADLDLRQPTVTLDNAYRRAGGATSESRLDYVFSRGGGDRGIASVNARRIFNQPIEVTGEPGAYSDHAGVLAEIEVGGPGLAPTPPEPEALKLARELLDTGRARAEARQRNERIGAGASFAVGVGAAWASMRAPWSRRTFLRTGLWSSAALAAASGTGLLTLSDGYVPDELTGYEAARAVLGSLR